MTGDGPISYCLITTSLRSADGANRTGWATYAEVMADALRRGGIAVTVLAVHEARGAVTENDDTTPGVVHLRLKWRYLVSLLAPGIAEGLQLLGAVRRLDRDHHYAVIEGPNVAGLCWALALWFRRRFVLRVHTSLVGGRGDLAEKRIRRRAFKRSLDAFTARSAQRVVTHSKAHAATIAVEYGVREADILILPHAVPDPGPTSAGHPRRILAIANASRRKGVDILVQAFADIHADVPDAELVIVGTSSGELAEILAKLPRPAQRLTGQIHALGPISDQALDLEWQRAGVVVVPSRYESFGLVAVEGMARGKAVVASEGGALAEVVGDGGVVVGPENPGALARALLDVLASPERREQLGRAGRQRYETCYRPEELTRKMSELISQF